MENIKTYNVGLEVGYSAKEFAAELRQLAEALEQTDHYTTANQIIKIPADAMFNMEYGREGDEQELKLEIGWSAKKSKADDSDSEEAAEKQ